MPNNLRSYVYNRTNLEKEYCSSTIKFPEYKCSQNIFNRLVVVENKVPGEALYKCTNKVIENFIDIFTDKVKKQIITNYKSKEGYEVYNILFNQNLLFQNILPKNSSYYKLNEICNKPFSHKSGYCLTQFNHGQLLPPNVYFYDKKPSEFYFIDFEPKLIGIGPYAYDLIFFIIYSIDLISNNYLIKIKENFFNEKEYEKWTQYFLAQILGGQEIKI